MIHSPIAELQPFADAGVLGLAELHAAASIQRAMPTTPTGVLLAYALALRAPLHGHVCVDLASASVAIPVEDADVQLDWPDLEPWLAEVKASPLVRPQQHNPDGLRRKPLALDGTRVYLDRYATYEALVAHQLLARANQTAVDRPETRPSTSELLDRFFPQDPLDKQRQAAEVALTKRLAVIAGGPGTGKTRTVARLLAAALSQAHTNDSRLAVALAAPTGKAATRMTDAIRNELDQLTLDQLTLDQPVTHQLSTMEASTIHRLLGPTGGNRFVHDRHNPLPHDLVIVDESSMVSLPLMARLLDALRPRARVVIVGDPFQLASVEAGAVLGDLIDASNLPDSAVRANTVALDRVHRFGADSGIAVLADAIRAGDAAAALAVLADDNYPDATLIDPSDNNATSVLLAQATAAATETIGAATAGSFGRAFRAATRVKVLAATRQGPLGVHWWTDEITRRSSQSIAEADQHNPWYIGRPVLVTQNDPVLRVFNGDVGIVAEQDGVRCVGVEQPGGEGDEPEIRWIPSIRLGSVETWWAMTIHKSQGSEFQHVIVALPTVDSPVVSRELLYTGITRAKTSVAIVATRSALRRGINRRIIRTSGLPLRLNMLGQSNFS